MKKFVKLIVILMLVSNIQASDKFDILKKFENAPSWVLTPTISKSKYYVVGSAKDDGYGYTKQYEEAIYNGWVELSRINNYTLDSETILLKDATTGKLEHKVNLKTNLVKSPYKIEKSWTSPDNEFFVLLSMDKLKRSELILNPRTHNVKSYLKDYQNDNDVKIISSFEYQCSYRKKTYKRNNYKHLNNKESAKIYNNLPKWIHNPNSLGIDEVAIGIENIKSFNSFYLVKESALLDARYNLVKNINAKSKKSKFKLNIDKSYIFKQYLSKDGNLYILVGRYDNNTIDNNHRYNKYISIVDKYSKELKVESSLILGIIGAESFFNPLAKSHIPAYGLMQINSFILSKENKSITYRELYNPDTNIKLGTKYISTL